MTSYPAYLDSISEHLNKPKVTTPDNLNTRPQLKEETVNDINTFLKRWSAAAIKTTEGSVIPAQIQFFAEILQNPNIKNILEIGFNGGLSAGCFLAASPKTRVVSLDIGAHEYVLKGQQVLQNLYPGRLFLVIGDSADSLHQLVTYHPEYRPDLVFLDGGHTWPTPATDLAFALRIVRQGGIIVIDDVFTKENREPDVLRAVKEACAKGQMAILQQFEAEGRGWVVCKPIY